MKRSVVRLGSIVVIALAAAVASCRTDKPTGSQIDREGEFSFTSTELGDTAMAGKATFSAERVDGIPTVTFTFLGKAPGFSIALSGPGLPNTTEGEEIGTGDDQFSGALTITRAGGPETYTLTGGSLAYTRTGLGDLSGTINFTGSQTSGPELGRIVRGSGNFRAACSTECGTGTS